MKCVADFIKQSILLCEMSLLAMKYFNNIYLWKSCERKNIGYAYCAEFETI